MPFENKELRKMSQDIINRALVKPGSQGFSPGLQQVKQKLLQAKKIRTKIPRRF